MRRVIAVVAAVAVAAAWTIGRPTPAASEDGIEVYFSPRGGCTDAIIDEIQNAEGSILVQAYSFTSAPIAKALLNAHNRGVSVRVVLDSSQRTAQYSSATFFLNQGIPVFIDSKHAIAHNKVILLDGKTVITGSFNFSKAAEERNAENLLVIENKPALMKAYRRNFDQHLKRLRAVRRTEPERERATQGTIARRRHSHRDGLHDHLRDQVPPLWVPVPLQEQVTDHHEGRQTPRAHTLQGL